MDPGRCQARVYHQRFLGVVATPKLCVRAAMLGKHSRDQYPTRCLRSHAGSRSSSTCSRCLQVPTRSSNRTLSISHRSGMSHLLLHTLQSFKGQHHLRNPSLLGSTPDTRHINSESVCLFRGLPPSGALSCS